MSKYFVVDAATGRIRSTVTATSMDDIAANAGDGTLVVPAEDGIDPRTSIWTAEDGFVPIVVPLEDVKAARWAAIKAMRDIAGAQGVDTPFGRFDSDAVSLAAINGAVTAALVCQAQGIAFSQSWTLADNSSVTLDAGSMLAVGLAAVGWIDAIHQRSRVLRGRIEAATSAAEVDAIEWILVDVV